MHSTQRPDYGNQLLPTVLDELALKTPTRLYAAVPKTADVTDGFRDITVADMAKGVDYMTHWIIDRYGSSDIFETISCIGTSDLRGAIVFVAAVKAGYKLLLPSPRNPSAVNISLMQKTGSTKLLHATEVTPIAQQLLELRPELRVDVLPTFQELMDSSPEHFPFTKSLKDSSNDPVVVLHSSGSTGVPKPITMTHGSFAVLDNEHNLPQVPGRRKRDWSMWTFDGEARVYTVFPFFHLAGFLALTVQTIFMNASPVLGPPHLIPDGPLLKNVMLHQKLRSIFLPPAVIEAVLQEPNGIDVFKDLDFLAYSGAPFNQDTGAKLSTVVELISPFGSTEIYPQPELAPVSVEDWAWHEFNPITKHEMRLYDSTQMTYELVILVDEDCRDRAAVYHNLPGTKEYPTKDLFIRHPDPAKTTLYKYYGRRDDIIVLANGEKFNPVPAEVRIATHAILKGAFLIGNGRTQAALLIEPKEPLKDANLRRMLIDELWPTVEECNTLVPGQGRIHRHRILCASPEKPFTRTGKGTIVRKLTEQSYEKEIDELYSKMSTFVRATATLQPTVKTTFELADVIKFVRAVLVDSFPQSETLGEFDDFFIHGLDSIQTLDIVAGLKHSIRGHSANSVAWISPRTIFQYSNVVSLAKVIQAFLSDGRIPIEQSDAVRVREINEMVQRYTKDLSIREPTEEPAMQPAHEKGMAVALLGSTGFLGTHLVARFLHDPHVAKVYCLNRDPHAPKRQQTSLAGLLSPEARDQLENKIQHITIDMAQPRLGLTMDDYEMLAKNVHVFVYNAWRLDFGISLRSFEPFLQPARAVIDLSISSAHRRPHDPLKIVFVSSISSVGELAKTTIAPEAFAKDPLAAFRMGYADSKHVAERILNAASETSALPISVVRVGQVGGPSAALLSSIAKSGGGVHGGPATMWVDQAYISAVARTARRLGTIPSHFMDVNWVPVDTIAGMIWDIALDGRGSTAMSEAHALADGGGAKFFHIVDPVAKPWDLVVDVVSQRIGKSLARVALPVWVKGLREVSQGGDSDIAVELPAIKMLDFYDMLGDGIEGARWESKKVSQVSAIKYPEVDRVLLGKWLESWDF